jgi:hypothetical protein
MSVKRRVRSPEERARRLAELAAMRTVLREDTVVQETTRPPGTKLLCDSLLTLESALL